MDIGTNSVRLLLVRINPNRSTTVLSQQKEVVRLGENEFVDNHLRPEAMQRAALVCRKFAEMARTYGAEEIVAIATSATREARNQAEFTRLLRQEAGIEVRTISGREEARLIYLGVSTGVHLDGQQTLFIDIGGGSTELAVGDQAEHRVLESLKLGAIRLTSLFFMPNEDSPVSPERYALIKRYVRNAAIRPAQRLAQHRVDLAVGSSGTIENLAEIAWRKYGDGERGRDDVLTLDQLREVVADLCGLPLEERRKVPGINPGRADIIIAGAAILETLMEVLEIDRLRVSDRGLREGLIADYLARSHPGLLTDLSVRERSVLQLARACQIDEDHAETVRDLAWQLFDSGRDLGLHSLGSDARELLGHAAILHDIGALLSYQNHQAHSYYLIRNSDLLGFDHTEIGIVAAVARFHRKGYPKKKHPEYKALSKRSRKVVRPLSLFLRLAESLDRSHAGLIRRAEFVDVDAAHVGVNAYGPSDCHLEIWGARSNAKVFRKAFKRELLVRHVRDDPAEQLALVE